MFVSEGRPRGRARSALLAGSSGLELGYGRFMQPDPLGYDDGLNWYNYAGGDPVNFTDPSGLDRCSDQGLTTSDPGGVVGSSNDFAIIAPTCGSPIEGLGGSAGGNDGGSSGGGGEPAAPPPPSPPSPKSITCKGTVTFSAVGPLPQAPGDSAFAPGTKPANGTVAIAGAQTFGFGRKALREGAAADIQIYPQGLDAILAATGGPPPPYSVGDYGDANIRNAPGTRFDIYRFDTMKGARAFGVKQNVQVTIIVPPGGHCPAGTSAQ